MRFRSISWATVFAGIGASTSAVSANLLVNPSFEQPDLSAGQIITYGLGQTIGSGWDVVAADSNNISVLIGTPYAGGGTVWPDASEGSNILYIGDSLRPVTVGQTVALDAATPYRLSFDLAGFTSGATGSNGARVIVDVLKDNVSILTSPATFDRPAISGFAGQTLEFTTLAAGSYQLKLSSPENFGTNVDNFNLVVIPEPTSLAAAGGLLFIRRRRA